MKVFSKEKYIRDMGDDYSTWIDKCDGKPVVDGMCEDFIVHNNWCIEVEDAMFKRSDLKTGMFGKMSDGRLFVIVNTNMVYQSGTFERICYLTDELTLGFANIDILVNAYSFDNATCNIHEGRNILWERKKIPTMKEVFLERNPNAPLYTNGIPKSCPHHIDKNWTDECFKHNCVNCWNRPIPNVEEED